MNRTSSWRQRLGLRIHPAAVRAEVEHVNDGILAIAGFSQGLYGGENIANLWQPIILMASIAGAISVACVALSAALADRDAERLAAKEQQRHLELEPEEQIGELAEHYLAKGLSATTARVVAEELHAADGLDAQMELEGFDHRTTVGGAVARSLWAGLAFMLGAAVPILISVLAPGSWRDEYTAVAVAMALALTSVVLARLGHTTIWQTLLRSIFIGLAAMGSSYLVGVALL